MQVISQHRCLKKIKISQLCGMGCVLIMLLFLMIQHACLNLCVFACLSVMKINGRPAIVTSNVKSHLFHPSMLSNISISSKTDYHCNAIRQEEICSAFVLGSPSSVGMELDLHPHLLRVVLTVDTLIHAEQRPDTYKRKKKQQILISNFSRTHLTNQSTFFFTAS